MSFDKPNSNCGIFGVFNDPNASTLTYYGLLALQHRGQEACGITISKNENGKNIFVTRKGRGLVSEVFSESLFTEEDFNGCSAIGHNRYSTTGSDLFDNIQPFKIKYRDGNLAISHNGNLTNAFSIRNKLVDDGAIFRSTSDTEVILHLIARSRQKEQVDQIKDALNQVRGAYSLVILTDTALYGIRDPYGVRPLVLGEYKNSYLFASETCAFDLLHAKYIREVHPGEIVKIDLEAIEKKEPKSFWLDNIPSKTKKCIFEYIYFSRPDSIVFGENVDKIRRKLGKTLAREHYLEADETAKLKVISVPDSSNTIAIGYQDQLRKMNIPSKIEIGLIRSHYIGRTFIQPGQDKRELSVRIKFNTVKGVLNNQRIIIVDDSIVRGTTSKSLIDLIREAGPKEVHMRISSPPILFPCQYGMDFPSKDELIANKCGGDINKIKEEIGVDSLQYLSYQGLIESMPEMDEEQYCTACFNGNYPIKIDESFSKTKAEDI